MIKVYKGSEDVNSLIISNRKNYYDECDKSAIRKATNSFFSCVQTILDKIYYAE